MRIGTQWYQFFWPIGRSSLINGLAFWEWIKQLGDCYYVIRNYAGLLMHSLWDLRRITKISANEATVLHIHKTNTNTQIQTHKYKYANMYKHTYTNTNMHLGIRSSAGLQRYQLMRRQLSTWPSGTAGNELDLNVTCQPSFFLVISYVYLKNKQ